MGRHVTTEAIVLKVSRFGEIHKSVTMLTPSGGVLHAIAHGALKMKSRLRSSTEPFMLISADLYHDPVRDSYKITDAETRVFPFGITQSPDRFFAASLFVEIVLRSFGGGESGEEMFRLLADALAALDTASVADEPFIVVQFVFRTLDLNGFLPRLNSCGRCGKIVDETAAVVFHRPSREIVCSACTSGRDGPFGVTLLSNAAAENDREYGNASDHETAFEAAVPPGSEIARSRKPTIIRINPGARRYLEKTSGLGFSAALGIKVDRDTIMNIKRMMYDLIEGVLGGPLMTVKSGEGIV
jgi:DNA repair protein RecO (recombination protein O)